MLANQTRISIAKSETRQRLPTPCPYTPPSDPAEERAHPWDSDDPLTVLWAATQPLEFPGQVFGSLGEQLAGWDGPRRCGHGASARPLDLALEALPQTGVEPGDRLTQPEHQPCPHRGTGSGTETVVPGRHLARQASKMRWRSRGKLARPYIWRLRYLTLVLAPSIGPLL